MTFYAHKREGPDGTPVWQTVYDHLLGTARRAAQCLRPAGLDSRWYLAGQRVSMGTSTMALQQ